MIKKTKELKVQVNSLISFTLKQIDTCLLEIKRVRRECPHSIKIFLVKFILYSTYFLNIAEIMQKILFKYIFGQEVHISKIVSYNIFKTSSFNIFNSIM